MGTKSMREFVSVENRIKDLEVDLKNLVQEFRTAKKNTDKLLALSAKVGITKVGICRKLDDTFPFGAGGNIFANGKERTEIWGVVEQMGISGGCGNSNQHQLSTAACLVEGVYELKAGKWNRTQD